MAKKLLKNTMVTLFGASLVLGFATEPVVTWGATTEVEQEETTGKIYVGFGTLSEYSNFDERQNTGGSAEVIGSIVLFDEDGKIIDVNSDSYEIRKAFVADEEGNIKIKEKGVDQTIGAFPHIRPENPDTLYTKFETGEDYGIDNIEGNLGKDWYLQQTLVEDAMVGMTVDEVLETGFAGRDDQTKPPLYPLPNINPSADNDAISGASIMVDTQLRTTIEAWNNRVELVGYTIEDVEDLEIGLGFAGDLDSANKTYTITVAGSVFDGDEVAYTTLDAVEIPYEIQEFDGYELVMIDSDNYQTRKTSFDETDAGYIQTMNDLNLEKDGTYYSVYKNGTGEGFAITDNKYTGKVVITEDEVYMVDENSVLKPYDEFEAAVIGKSVEEIKKEIKEDSVMKEALTYSKVNAENPNR